MISLKNKNVAELVGLQLDKIDNSFSEEELNKVTELVYDTYTINNEVLEDDLSDLKYFKSLKKLYLIHVDVEKDTAKSIFILPSLENLSFDKVNFYYPEFISNLKLKKIAFINTNLEDFSFLKDMNNLEKIEIIGAKEIDLEIFKSIGSLKELDLEYCNISNLESIYKLSRLEGIIVNNTNIEKLDFLQDFDYLKYVGLDRKQIENNKKIIQKLKDKNITILIDGLIEY